MHPENPTSTANRIRPRLLPRAALTLALFCAGLLLTLPARAQCTPTVTASRAGAGGSVAADAYDRDLGTYFDSTYSDWQHLQIDFGCAGELYGFRRYMTDSQGDDEGIRYFQGEGFSYRDAGGRWVKLTGATTSGWQSYVNYAPHAWHSVDYGWSAWLLLHQPVKTQTVRFDWDDDFDRVHEIEVFFVPAQGPPEYEIINLSALIPSQPAESSGVAINRRGVVVGNFEDPATGERRAALWDLDFQGHALGYDLDPPCTGTCLLIDRFALDVNDHDEVVGYRGHFTSPRATIWQALPTTARPLPGLYQYSISNAINNESVVAGVETVGLGNSAAYRLHWDASRDGTLVDPNVYARSTGYDVNDRGDVVGQLTEPSGAVRAFFYDGAAASGGGPTILPVPAGMTSTFAGAISNDRVAVGFARDASGVDRATVWRHDAGQWTVELLPSSAATSIARGVNDLGHAVGQEDKSFAVLWRDGQATPLEPLLPPQAQSDWDLVEARDLNDRGEIVGWGYYQGQQTGFVMRPVRGFAIAEVPDAAALNDRGWVVGTSGVGPTEGWLLTLAAPGPVGLGTGTVARDVGDQNAIAGWDATYEAVLWDELALVDLPSPQPGTHDALGVSASGHAVGHSDVGSNADALFWTPEQQVSLPFTFDSVLSAVNAGGHAVGVEVTGTGARLPLRWSERDGHQQLDYGGDTEVWDVDSRGFAVGQEASSGPPPYFPPGNATAKLWDLAGARRGLGTLASSGSSDLSRANAINDRRQIVGVFNAGIGDPTAFLWYQEAMIDLNLLLPPGTPWRLTEALDVNDGGQIVGKGENPPGGASTGFLLTLSSEAETAISLCRGWCQPILECFGEEEIQLEEGAFWTRPDYPAFGGCVNGCIAFMMDPSRPHDLDDERAVRDCFLDSEELCFEDWRDRTQQCCDQLGLGDCEVYYP